MTRPVNLDRPVRCARCGEKFTRTHGRERLCLTCKRPDVRTRLALRAAAAAAPADEHASCMITARGDVVACQCGFYRPRLSQR